jgi:hypothetical protein
LFLLYVILGIGAGAVALGLIRTDSPLFSLLRVMTSGSPTVARCFLVVGLLVLRVPAPQSTP